jgi:hypothetical protein
MYGGGLYLVRSQMKLQKVTYPGLKKGRAPAPTNNKK